MRQRGFALRADRAKVMMEYQSAVAWPRDVEARQRFLCVAAAMMAGVEDAKVAAATDDEAVREGERWREVWEDLYQECGGRRMLLMSPSADTVVEEFQRGMKRGLLAGRVLNFAILLAKHAPAEASINKAKEIVYHHIEPDLAALFGLPRSHRPVDEAWSSHRCVAHLGAAILNTRGLMALGELPGGQDKPSVLTLCPDPAELTSLLRTAATAQRLGAAIVPHSRDEPILPMQDLMHLPGTIEPYGEDEVEFPPLPARIVESLRKGRAGKKRRR